MHSRLAVGKSKLVIAYRASWQWGGKSARFHVLIAGLQLLRHHGADGGRDRKHHAALSSRHGGGLHILGEDLIKGRCACQRVATSGPVNPSPRANVTRVACTLRDKFRHGIFGNTVGVSKLHSFEYQHVAAEAEQVVDEFGGTSRPNRADMEQAPA